MSNKKNLKQKLKHSLVTSHTSPQKNIIGRFAPSPTGQLHFGSLIAATASYLSAKQNPNDQWLLRIEDLDLQRSHTKHAQSIIHTLEQFGFKWDGEILYQSTRNKAYQTALDLIITQTYPCSCSRKHLNHFYNSHTTPQTYANIYPGFCREKPHKEQDNLSIRLQTDSKPTCFIDQCQGKYCQNIKKEVGDFILKRSDGLFAYQLAVVVDDEHQGVNQVVRGADLFDNTPRQLFLQQLLHYQHPNYLHFPVAVTANGKKLSKQNLAPEISLKNKRLKIIQILKFLGQIKPEIKDFSNLDDLWNFAVQNWDSNKIPTVLTKAYEN